MAVDLRRNTNTRDSVYESDWAAVLAEHDPPRETGKASVLFKRPNRMDRFFNMIASAASLSDAAGTIGVPITTLTSWVKKGRQGNGDVYELLYKEIRKAMGHMGAQLAGRVYDASRHDWKAARWILACRTRDWCPASDRESVDRNTNMILDVAKRTLRADQYEKLCEALAEAADGLPIDDSGDSTDS